MLETTEDDEQIIERIAALDIGKAEVACCVRVPDPAGSGKRLQEVATYSTMTRSLLGMCDRLGELGVTRVVMEATSVIRGVGDASVTTGEGSSERSGCLSRSGYL
jgi:transposase